MSEPARPNRARPVHTDWRYLGLVVVGGAVGTALREIVTLSSPSSGLFPAATFGINLLGSFLLGVLLESLFRRGPDQGVRRIGRLVLGAGVLGGFTTYSTLATDTVTLLARGQSGTAVLYALGTVVLGVVAAGVGLVAAAAGHRHFLLDASAAGDE